MEKNVRGIFVGSNNPLGNLVPPFQLAIKLAQGSNNGNIITSPLKKIRRTVMLAFYTRLDQ